MANAEYLTKLSIPAELTQVRVAATWLEQIGILHDIPAAKLHHLDLCLEEVLMNIIMHSGLADQGTLIELMFELRQHGDVTKALVTVSDAGARFDPLAIAPRPLPASLAEAEPGGLGLMILRSNARHLSYRFDDERNHLTFGQSWDGDSDKNIAQTQHA